jgi:hypothetical protein
MILTRLFDHHFAGGIYFMAPLTVLFLVGTAIFLYVLIKKNFSSRWVDAIKQVGILTFAYGVFGTLTGFIQMFDALEAMKETLPLAVISGGVKTGLLNVVYGAGYFCVLQVMYLVAKLLAKQTSGAES